MRRLGRPAAVTDAHLADVIARAEAKAAARQVELHRIRMRAWARWLTWAYWYLPTPYGAYADHYLWPLVRRWGFRAEAV